MLQTYTGSSTATPLLTASSLCDQLSTALDSSGSSVAVRRANGGQGVGEAATWLGCALKVIVACVSLDRGGRRTGGEPTFEKQLKGEKDEDEERH